MIHCLPFVACRSIFLSIVHRRVRRHAIPIHFRIFYEISEAEFPIANEKRRTFSRVLQIWSESARIGSLKIKQEFPSFSTIPVLHFD